MLAKSSLLAAAVALAALTGCGGNPVVHFPTAGSAPPVSAAPTTPVGQTQTASASTYNYSCNEGIPLIVIVDEASGGAVVSYSHDSSPFQQMTRVPAASGALYTDGTYDLHMQGNEASLAYSGGDVWDHCIRI